MLRAVWYSACFSEAILYGVPGVSAHGEAPGSIAVYLARSALISSLIVLQPSETSVMEAHTDPTVGEQLPKFFLPSAQLSGTGM